METTASTLRTTLRRRRRIPPPTNSRANSRHRSSKEKTWFGEDAVSVSLLLPQQNELQFECHSLPPTPSPASPSFSIEKERGYHIHVLHYHLALQKLPKAKSVNYNTNNITIIGVQCYSSLQAIFQRVPPSPTTVLCLSGSETRCPNLDGTLHYPNLKPKCALNNFKCNCSLVCVIYHCQTCVIYFIITIK